MVATVRDDPYQCLMRKIGYSVGLETLPDRVIELTNLYVEQRELNYALFRDLVTIKFQRNNERSIKEFANVYGSLNLLKLYGKKLRVLPNLDTLSILRQHFTDDQKSFTSAAKVVLMESVLEADGEIFINGLAADFDTMRFKTLLESMIRIKRERMAKVIKSPRSALLRIYDIIDIKTQLSNKRSSSGEQGNLKQSRFGRRTEALSKYVRRITPLSAKLDPNVDISNHYLEEVSGTRKKWAEDLGLFENGHKTAIGFNLLLALENNLRLKQDAGCYIFWPYSSDLLKLRIQPEEIDAEDLDQWKLLCAIAQGVGNLKVAPYDDKADYIDVIDLLRVFHGQYREGNKSLASIRHQLPLFVVHPCLVALYVVKSRDIPPLPQILDAESKKKVRKVQRIIIRGTEGGIIFNEDK